MVRVDFKVIENNLFVVIMVLSLNDQYCDTLIVNVIDDSVVG